MSETEVRYITPPLRASYPKLWEPEVNDRGDNVWGITLLIEDTPEGRKCLADLEKLQEEAGKEKWGTRFAQVSKQLSFKWAIRRDVEKYGDCEPKVIAFVSSRSYGRPPGVVSIYPNAEGKPSRITDPALVYPGCYVKASLRPFASDIKLKAGGSSQSISFGLGNVQKVRDADRIDAGRVAPENEFVADPNAQADLADL